MDEGVTNRLYGNYRAEVIDNKDTDKFGRVKVWIPDLMPDIPKQKGLWARPANNPVGGRNAEGDSESHYMGTSYIPKKGSWVWVFFETGNINRPYYFGALDLQNTKVLPENQLGSNYEDKWTIFKSHKGRTIIISDDPDDRRVEITGRKKKLTGDSPTGGTDSVYEIDANQNTILLDERSGQEKILIRTYKGDFIHIDDIVDLVMITKDKLKPGEVLNLGSGKGISFLNLAKCCCKVLDHSAPIINDSTRPEGVFARVANIDQMKKHYTPTITLEEGVARVANYIMNNNHYKNYKTKCA